MGNCFSQRALERENADGAAGRAPNVIVIYLLYY